MDIMQDEDLTPTESLLLQKHLARLAEAEAAEDAERVAALWAESNFTTSKGPASTYLPWMTVPSTTGGVSTTAMPYLPDSWNLYVTPSTATIDWQGFTTYNPPDPPKPDPETPQKRLEKALKKLEGKL